MARASRASGRGALLSWAAFGLLAFASPAHASGDTPMGTLVPQLLLGAGYDDNLFLDAFPVGPLDTPARADAIFDVEPRLIARLGIGRHALSLSIDDLERFTISNGHLRDADVHLGYRSPPLGRVELFGGVGWEHWDATLYPDNRSEVGSGNVAARIVLGGPVEGLVALRGAVRGYPTRGQTDGEARPSILVRARLPRNATVEGSYAFLHLASSEPRAELDRHTLAAAAAVQPVPWLGLRADYAFSAQHLPAGAVDASGAALTRDDLRHEVHALATVRALRWLEAFVEYDLLISTSDSSPGRYLRNQVLCGLTAYAVFNKALRRSLVPEVHNNQVTFRYHGKATTVSVVGDWNGWDADAGVLHIVGEIFEGTYSVPPGRHEYALSVNGVIEPPPEAHAYVSDSFGGRNGILVVH